MMVERLKKIASECEYIKANAIVDEQGLVISKYEKPDVKCDVEELASSVINPVLRLSEIASDSMDENESLEEVVFFTTSYVVVVNKLAYETFLVTIIEKTPIYGKARFKLRAKLPEIKSSL